MKILANWTPTPDELAQAFCEMHTDEQAKFFVGVADYADDWPGAIAPISQWHAVGRHLAREIAARSVLNAIVDAADECCDEPEYFGPRDGGGGEKDTSGELP